MPGGISTPTERGYFTPGQTIQDAVSQYVQLQIRQAQEARAQQEAQQAMEIRAAQEQRTGKQFGTEQGVREAQAQPIVDPNVIRLAVLAAQARGGNQVGDELFKSRIGPLPRLALGAGHLPITNNSTATFDPATGAPVNTTTNQLQDPATGLYAPFGGGRVQGAPPVSTTTSIKPPEAGAPATPGLAVLREEDTVPGPDGKRIVTRTTEKAQRITPPHGDAANAGLQGQYLAAAADANNLADEAEADGDTERADQLRAHAEQLTSLATQLKGVLAKKAAPTPARGDTVESLTAALKTETDPAARAALQGRIDAKNRQFTPKPAPKSLAQELMERKATQAGKLNPNGTPVNAVAPGAGGKSGPLPTEGTAGAPIGNLPSPTPPAITPAVAASPATPNANAVTPGAGNYVKGTVYRDKNGKRALWDGAQFVAPPSQ